MKMISVVAIIAVAGFFTIDAAARPRDRARQNESDQENYGRGNYGNGNDDGYARNNYRNPGYNGYNNGNNNGNNSPAYGYNNNNNGSQNGAYRNPNAPYSPNYPNHQNYAAQNYVRPQNLMPVPTPTVARVVPVAPAVPVPTLSPPPVGDPRGQITVWNPTDSGGAVSFAFDDDVTSLNAGQTRTLTNAKRRVIAFGSGGSLGELRYTLSPGTYKFKATEAGWKLYKTEDAPPAPTAVTSTGRS